uniref:DNA_mis_repair domain-containing protein n=1 Tax=Strongyloides papillosus TaxID=174720 RepID=A0A0N5CBI3_STREA
MPRINKLDREVCRNLTTGQVCIDLSGIVKELVDNSLDAGATRISIKLYNDGIEKVQVEDNGSGIEKEDFGMIAELHATSKIKSYEDFTAVQTYGFRGEALNSLCSSSKLTVLTKVEGGKGYHLEFDNTGKYLPEKTKDAVMNVGTTVIVTDFMCHYPVRRKEYETKASKEVQKIARMLQNYAFSKVDLAFELLNIVNNKTTVLMRSPGGNAKIESAISSIFSDKARFLRDTIKLEDADISDEAYELFKLDKAKLDFKKIDHVKFEGCISGMKNVVKNSVDYIFLSVNKRPISNPDIKKAVKMAYLKSNPTFGIIFVLQLTLPSNYFDVNCSPLKDLMECTIMDLILAKVYSCVDATLMKENPPDTCEMKRKNIEESEGLGVSRKRQVPIDNFVNKVVNSGGFK